MKERINQVMKMKAVNAAELADLMHITRPSLSHIINGRNNPSLDFVVRMKEAFPELSLDWLMFGKGSMTTSALPERTQPIVAKQPLLFEEKSAMEEIKIQELEVEKATEIDLFSAAKDDKAITVSETKSPVSEIQPAEKEFEFRKKEVPVRDEQGLDNSSAIKKPVKMILVYDDDTFLVYDYQKIKTAPSY